MNGNVKFGLTPGRCFILCALSALIGCALFLFSASGAEATLALGWFPFTQLQGLTAGADGLTPPGVCLALAALPAVGFLLLARSGVGLGSVSFPVSALIFCFAALLGARFAAAHKRLRDENDMFI